MIIPTADNITKFRIFTAQNRLRRACQIMCLLLVLPLIACGSGGTDGTGPGGNDGMGPGGTDGTVDPTFVAYLEEGDLTLNNFLKTDTGKAVGEDDHLGLYLNTPHAYRDITDLAIEAGSAKTIKITVKEVIEDYRDDTTRQEKTGLVKTLSYADPDDDGRFMLKEGIDEWGQGLFSSTSNSDGSTVMGLVSKEGLSQSKESSDRVLVVTGKEYAWDNVDIQSGVYTFGGKALTTAVGYKSVGTGEGQNSNDVWFTMTLETPTAVQVATRNLPTGADAMLSITNWHLNDDINAADKNFLPLPAAVSLKGGVGSNNLRLVKGDGTTYVGERFLNFGTYEDLDDRLGGIRKGSPFDTMEAETNFYTEVRTSSITARLYGEPGSLADNKAVIAGTYHVDVYISGGGYARNWGVYVLKQK